MLPDIRYQSSGTVQLDKDDYAVLTVWNRYQTAQTVAVEIAVWLPDESRLMNIQHNLAVPASTGTGSVQIASLNIPLTDGAMVGFRITNDQANRRGETFMRLQLRKSGASGFARQVLASCYLTNGIPVTQNTPLQSSLDGPGCLRQITWGAPAVGTQQVITVPQLVRWRLCFVQQGLQTSAVAGNRTTNIEIHNEAGGGVSAKAYNTATQAASLNQNHYFGDYQSVGAVGGHFQVNLPGFMCWLSSQGQVIITAAGLDGGDQFAATSTGLEEWIEV